MAASLTVVRLYHTVHHLLSAWGAFAFAEVMEGMVLDRRLVGRSLGLYPVFALGGGGRLFGFVGLVWALSVSQASMAGLGRVHERYQYGGWSP